MSDAWFPTERCLIGGVWTAPAGGGTLPMVDPSDGREFGRIARGGAADIDAAVAAARAAQDGDWGRATAAERGRALARLGRLVESRVPRIWPGWRRATSASRSPRPAPTPGRWRATSNSTAGRPTS